MGEGIKGRKPSPPHLKTTIRKGIEEVWRLAQYVVK
jgi:hypothetical protein